MKAFVQKEYGPPETLVLTEVPRPIPGEGEVLVRIRATAINDFDWAMVTGIPRVYRLLFGLLRPRRPIPGMELSGVIEALGENVSSFSVGDAVYGDISDHGTGSYATYIAISAKALAPKPADMSFEEAASISHAANLAVQGLVDHGGIREGQEVLINGGGGGVGTLGFQIARTFGAKVTGVDTGAKLAMMADLGFDQVLDYKEVDFTKTGRRYDLILDCKTSRSPFAHARALKKGGRYVTVGGSPARLIETLLLGWLVRLLTRKRIRIVALKPNKDLTFVERLFSAGSLRCVIDGPHALAEAPRLLRLFGEGGHSGKLVMRNVDSTAR